MKGSDVPSSGGIYFALCKIAKEPRGEGEIFDPHEHLETDNLEKIKKIDT